MFFLSSLFSDTSEISRLSRFRCKRIASYFSFVLTFDIFSTSTDISSFFFLKGSSACPIKIGLSEIVLFTFFSKSIAIFLVWYTQYLESLVFSLFRSPAIMSVITDWFIWLMSPSGSRYIHLMVLQTLLLLMETHKTFQRGI